MTLYNTQTWALNLPQNCEFAKAFVISDQALYYNSSSLLYNFKVTSIKFANNDKYMLACSSKDGSLSICDLGTSPPSVRFMLLGHKASVNGEVLIL